MSRPRALILFAMLFLLPPASASPVPEVFWSYDTGGTVTGVSISDGGNYTAAASSDGYVYFFNKSKKLMWKEKTESTPLKVAVSGDGSMVYAGDGSMVYLYNKTGHLQWDFLIGDEITDISITPDGNRITVSSTNGYVYMLNSVGGIMWKYQTNGPVLSAAISSDGRYVAAGTSGKNTYMLAREGNLLWMYIGKQPVDGVGILGSQVLIGERYPTLLKDGNNVGSYTDNVCDITGIKTAADGKYALVGCLDGEIYLLDGQRKKHWSYDAGKTTFDSSISPKGDFAAIGAGKTVYMLSSPDIATPIVEITKPKDGGIISGIVGISADIADDSSYTLRVLIDEDFACSKLPCNWNTGTAAEGEHVIEVEVNDSGGNVGKDSVKVTIVHGALGEIAGEITEKKEIIEDAQAELEEKEDALREKIDEAIPQDIPTYSPERDYSGIIKGTAVVLLLYAAAKIVMPGKKGRRGKRYKFKK